MKKHKLKDVSKESMGIITILIREIEDIMKKHKEDEDNLSCLMEIRYLLRTWIDANNLKLNEVNIERIDNHNIYSLLK